MRRIIIEGVIAGTLLAVIALLIGRNGQLAQEQERSGRNLETLMGEVKTYRVRDSLNAAKVGALELQLSEFEKYRAEDAELIESLKADKRHLERVASIQSKEETDLQGKAVDTLVMRDSVAVPAIKLSSSDKWHDFHALIAGGEFSGHLVARDSLMVVESVEMTRCIVKKWRKVKKRTITVISKNPRKKIENVEYIIIEK